MALVAFMTGVTPTAVAAPVIISLLEGRVEYLVAAVLLTNVSMAAMLPFVLPLVVSIKGTISTWDVMQSVLVIVFVPLALARMTSFLPERPRRLLKKCKPYSFYLWVTTMFLVTSKASSFIRHDLSISRWMLVEIAALSLAICVVDFGVGALLGGRAYRREASQALGQKNTSFTIWLSLTFINPVVALGPAFYVVYHNLWNSFQLYAFEKRRSRKNS